MKTNNIKGNLELYERIESLEKENIELKEKVNDCTEFIKILEQWFNDVDTDDTETNNNCIDMGTY